MKKVIYGLFFVLGVFCPLAEIYASAAGLDEVISPYKEKSIKALRTESISGNWKAQYWLGFERDSHETASMKKEAIKWWVSALQNSTLDMPEAKKKIVKIIADKIRGSIVSLCGIDSEKEYKTKHKDLLKKADEGDIEAKFIVGLDYCEKHTNNAVRPDLGFPLVEESALEGHQPAIDFLCNKAMELYGIEDFVK